MRYLNHPEAPQASEFIVAGLGLQNQIPQWYCDFVDIARRYMRQGGILDTAPTPTGAYQWFNAALIKRERMNPTDTQGLDQFMAQQFGEEVVEEPSQPDEYGEDLPIDIEDEV